jgi:hypothetical protein
MRESSTRISDWPREGSRIEKLKARLVGCGGGSSAIEGLTVSREASVKGQERLKSWPYPKLAVEAYAPGGRGSMRLAPPPRAGAGKASLGSACHRRHRRHHHSRLAPTAIVLAGLTCRRRRSVAPSKGRAAAVAQASSAETRKCAQARHGRRRPLEIRARDSRRVHAFAFATPPARTLASYYERPPPLDPAAPAVFTLVY